MSKQITAVLDQVILVNLDVKEWTGRKNLQPKDLVSAGTLPPNTLASLGHKKTIDPAALSKFGNIKKAMERACLEVGTRFLGGYAIPEAEFDQLAKTLDEQCEKANQAKTQLLRDYDALVEDWCKRHPGWETIIRQEIVPKSYVADRIRFEWTAFRIASVESTTENSEVSRRLEEKASSLGDQLFSEVETSAAQTYKKSYEGLSKVGQKAIRPVRTIQHKLKSLAFVDRRVKPILDEIDQTLERLPKTGSVTGSDFLALRGLVALLADAEAMKRAGARALGEDVDEDGDEDVDQPDQGSSEDDAVEVVETHTPETDVEPDHQPPQESDNDADEADEADSEEEIEEQPSKAASGGGWFFG